VVKEWGFAGLLMVRASLEADPHTRG
jgi:hypothetical protein